MARPCFGIRKILSLHIILVLFLFASCSKDGATGPAGPAGPAGATGATGATGESGATLISSDWIDVSLESGVYAFVYYGKIEDERITQNILDKGLVKMYAKAANTIYEIPNPAFDGLYFTATVGKIEIFSPTDWDDFSGYSYRFVLIPGE